MSKVPIERGSHLFILFNNIIELILNLNKNFINLMKMNNEMIVLFDIVQ